MNALHIFCQGNLHGIERVTVASLAVFSRADEVIEATVAIEHKSALFESVDQVVRTAEALEVQILLYLHTRYLLKWQFQNEPQCSSIDIL